MKQVNLPTEGATNMSTRRNAIKKMLGGAAVVTGIGAVQAADRATEIKTPRLPGHEPLSGQDIDVQLRGILRQMVDLVKLTKKAHEGDTDSIKKLYCGDDDWYDFRPMKLDGIRLISRLLDGTACCFDEAPSGNTLKVMTKKERYELDIMIDGAWYELEEADYLPIAWLMGYCGMGLSKDMQEMLKCSGRDKEINEVHSRGVALRESRQDVALSDEWYQTCHGKSREQSRLEAQLTHER